jgi:hypothetical protein
MRLPGVRAASLLHASLVSRVEDPPELYRRQQSCCELVQELPIFSPKKFPPLCRMSVDRSLMTRIGGSPMRVPGSDWQSLFISPSTRPRFEAALLLSLS